MSYIIFFFFKYILNFFEAIRRDKAFRGRFVRKRITRQNSPRSGVDLCYLRWCRTRVSKWTPTKLKLKSNKKRNLRLRKSDKRERPNRYSDVVRLYYYLLSLQIPPPDYANDSTIVVTKSASWMFALNTRKRNTSRGSSTDRRAVVT